MNKTLSILLGLVAILFFAIGGYKTENKTFGGSSPQGSAYNSTTTMANTFQFSAVASTTKTIKSGPGVLGSVVITATGAGNIYIYDGTTTVSHNDHPTTTLAAFSASTAAGTYSFDVAASRGIIVETSNGVAPTATITWQ